MVHADFAQHQSHTLTHGCGDSEQHAYQRQFQRQFAAVAAAQYADGDTGQRDKHRQHGLRLYLLTQREPCRDCGSNGRECHEQLAILGTDDQIALEQAEVSDDIAYKAREYHPQVGLGAGTGGQGRTAHHPKQDDRERECDDHTHQVERQVAHPLAAELAQQRRRRPRERHTYRYQFTDVLHACKDSAKKTNN